MSLLFKKHISADLSELKIIRTELQRLFNRFSLPANSIDQNLLIITEYLSNLFRHTVVSERATEISLECIQQRLTIRIIDSSELYQPLAELLQNDNNTPLIADESGMGMLLIKQLVSSYEYRPFADGCEFSFDCGEVSSTRARVMIVDDDAFMLTLLSEYLAADYQVTACNSVAIAKAELERAIPDLIISDIEMPDHDGIGFREYLANDLKLDLLPFIYLTGISDDQVKKLAISYGIDDYLQKPVSKDELLSRVSRVIRRYKQLNYTKALISDQQQQSQMQRRLPEQLTKLVLQFRQQTADSMTGDFVLHHQHDEVDYLVIGDVMGHGVDAAFYSYSYAGYIRAFLRASHTFNTLAELAKTLSDSIYQDGFLEQQLMTLLLIRCHDQEMEIISAGHPAPIIISNAGITAVNTSGPLLGLFPDQEYESIQCKLTSDASILAYTDGLIDALPTSNDVESFTSYLTEMNIYDEDPAQCLENIMACLPEKSARRVNDDVSCLLLSNQR